MAKTNRCVPDDHPIMYMDGMKDSWTTAGQLTALKAIRLKCYDCSGGSRSEVRKCTVESCPLFPFRCAPQKSS